MKKVDFEAHLYSPALLNECFGARTEPPFYRKDDGTFYFTNDFFLNSKKHMAQLSETCEERMAIMDKFGITKQVLSCSPGIELIDDARQAVEACHEVNDWMYSFVKKHPDRFAAWAALPRQDPDAACDELERCVKEYGFVGWLTFSNYGDTHPDDDIYAKIFDKAGELGAAVYVHPTQPCSGRLSGLGPHLAGGTFGFGVDTAITVMRLILKGTFDRNPGLKLLMGHLGEALPFTLDRLEERGRVTHGKHAPAVCELLPHEYFGRNIWVTTSGQYSHASFHCTREEMGIERMLIGSDYPYAPLETCEQFERELVLSKIDKEKLFYLNAERFFGIKA